MNKKLGIIALVIVVVLLLAGAGYYYMHMSTSKTPSYGTQAPTKSSNNTFGSIQEALMSHMSLSCDYTSGSMHTVAFIKNGMIRADITNSQNPSESGSVIIKDKKMYYWNGTTGMMMTMPDITGTMPTGTMSQRDTGQQTMQNLEQYKQYCKVATVADSEFDIPASVKFTDESQMMQKMPSMAMPSGIPSGVPTEYQQYMKMPPNTSGY